MPDNRISGNKTNTVIRALTETYVRKKIIALRNDPERSLRNLVDLALNISTGRFQQHFFKLAQTMLENPESGYYKLIPDIVEHVDEERLINFGINLGYNSLTAGAKTIRENEAKGGFNIPWIISLTINETTYPPMEHAYQSLIEQGTALGVYSWLFYVESGADLPLPLIKAHPDCAFLIVVDENQITEDFLAQAHKLTNLMIAVRYEKISQRTVDIFAVMRARKMLYSAFVFYDTENTEKKEINERLAELNIHHPAFTIFTPQLAMSGSNTKSYADEAHTPAYESRKKQTAKNISAVYNSVLAERNRQEYATVPMELYTDFLCIDGVISNDSCSLIFDRNGNVDEKYSNTSLGNLHLCRSDADTGLERLNFCTMPLLSILQTAYKKSQSGKEQPQNIYTRLSNR